MGLMIHSLGELPPNVARGYYVYLLDYGWREPLGEALEANYALMADLASRRNAVVIKGTVARHFADEVLSWHGVNGEPGEHVLPALMITTRNPHEFRAPHGSADIDHKMLLVPLKSVCSSTTDVANLIARLFSDIGEGKPLAEFEIVKELRPGVGGAIVDGLLIRPSFGGVGFDLKELIRKLKARKPRRLTSR